MARCESEFDGDSESDSDLEALLLISLLRRRPKRKPRRLCVRPIYSRRKSSRRCEYL